MKTKAILFSALLLICFAPCYAGSKKNCGCNPLVGAWTQKSDVDFGNVTYHSDGTFVKHVSAALGQPVGSNPPTFQTIQSGIYKKIGKRKYKVVYTTVINAPNATTILPTTPVFRAKNVGTITLNQDLVSATGTGTVTLYDINDLCLQTPLQTLPNINSVYCKLGFE